MGEAPSDSSESNTRKTATKELWLGTFYFTVPLNFLNNSLYCSCIHKYAKPNSIDISLEFEFQRISSWQFRITCTREPVRDTIPKGDYKFQFYCDIFDEDSRMFEMQSVETVAGENFSLKRSRQYFTLRDFARLYDVKILVKMIEYDIVFTENHVLQRDLFREKNKRIFSNESVLMDLYYILNVQRLEDIFTGRQNRKFIFNRRCFIQRASKYAEMIATYMRCKKESTRPPSIDFKEIMQYIFNGKTGILPDSDLVKLYKQAHYFGLDFLIILSQDYLLHRLAWYEMTCLKHYEACMFHVIDAAVKVNDENFFDIVVARLYMAKPFFDSLPLWRKLEHSNISSKFAIHFAQERLKKLDAEARKRCGGIAEASSSNI